MILLGVCALLYATRLAFFWIGVLRKGHYVPTMHQQLPKTSVIVPARNEEANVRRCIESLMRSDMPPHSFEVVVVNDRSSDATGTILDELKTRYPQLNVIHRTPADVHANLKGKPGALDQGIQNASGDIILMTDADCTVHPSWVRTMTSACFEVGTGMVCGFTSVRSNSFLDSVQDVEWTYSQLMARAGMNHGIPLGCFGNNLGIRRSIYDELGGYSSISFSITEDLALLQAVHKHGQQVHYLCEPSATVETLPCDTLVEYVRQRHRWARGGMALGGAATTFVVASLSLWIGLVASAFTMNWGWFMVFVLMRLVGDGSMVIYTLIRLQKLRRILDVVPSLTLLLCTELSLPFLLLRSKVTWKGQTF